jgi:hypothetical protein
VLRRSQLARPPAAAASRPVSGVVRRRSAVLVVVERQKQLSLISRRRARAFDAAHTPGPRNCRGHGHADILRGTGGRLPEPFLDLPPPVADEGRARPRGLSPAVSAPETRLWALQTRNSLTFDHEMNIHSLR